MYLAVAGLSCSTWDLPWVTQDLLLERTDSLVVVCGFSCSMARVVREIIRVGVDHRAP